MDVRQLSEFTYSLNSILYSLYIPRVFQELQTTYKLSVFACPACPVAPADGTGVGPEDRTGAPLFTQLNCFCTYLTGA